MNAPTTDKERPIHLVLGSGGARGLTHIGVIRVLQEQGYSIKSITGCSMGALVGALLVSGHLDEYEAWVQKLTRWDVLRFLDISLLGRSGMVKGDRLLERLTQWLGGIDMESLPIPLTVVAADIVSRKEVWISKGDLMDAVRASIAVPGVFSPLVTHGRVLVDGGILNPLPIPPAPMDNSTITVAVSLSGRDSSHPFGDPPLPAQVARADTQEAETNGETAAGSNGEKRPRMRFRKAKVAAEPVTELVSEEVAQALLADGEIDTGESGEDTQPAAVEHQPIDSFLDNLQRFFGRDRSGDNGDAGDAAASGGGIAVPTRAERLRAGSRPALTDVMLGMFNTMQDTIARHQLASNPPDILIDIPCNICLSHEFHKARDLIPAGAYWARRALVDQVDNARR